MFSPQQGTFLKWQPPPRFTHIRIPTTRCSCSHPIQIAASLTFTRPFGLFCNTPMELVDRVVAVLDRLPQEANPAIEFSMKCESEDAVDKGRVMAAEAGVGVGCSGGEPDVNPNRAVVALALLGVLQRCPPRAWGCCSCSSSCSEILCLRVTLLWRRGVGVAGWGGGVCLGCWQRRACGSRPSRGATPLRHLIAHVANVHVGAHPLLLGHVVCAVWH
jgi:hypothetical protein